MSGFRHPPSVLRSTAGLILVMMGHLACAADPPDPADPVEPAVPAGQSIYEYRCAGGKKVTAMVDLSDAERPRTVVSLEGDPQIQQVEMEQVMAASGFKSSNGQLIWWTKGDEGFLIEEDPPAGNGKMVAEDCKEVSMRPHDTVAADG